MLKYSHYYNDYLEITELSNPNVKSIMKNISAQNILPGIVAMAAGYTTKTKPGPSVATSCMGLPAACAMYPNTEKITKPAIKLVAELMTLVSNASLKMDNDFYGDASKSVRFLAYL